MSPQLTRAARLLVEPGRATAARTAARRRLRNRGSAALLTSARAWRYAISNSQQLLRDVAPTKRVHVARMRPRSSRRRARSPSAERRDRPRRLGRHAQRPHLDATESSTGDARRHLRRLVEILDPVEAAELLLRRGERSVRLQHLPVFVRAPSSPSTSAPAPRPIDRTSGMSLGPSTEPRTDRILGPSRLARSHEHHADLADDFHVYGVDWRRESRSWSLDGRTYGTLTVVDLGGRPWVHDHPLFILLNVAISGEWPGDPDDSTPFPATLLVDYVRVYRAVG